MPPARMPSIIGVTATLRSTEMMPPFIFTSVPLNMTFVATLGLQRDLRSEHGGEAARPDAFRDHDPLDRKLAVPGADGAHAAFRTDLESAHLPAKDGAAAPPEEIGEGLHVPQGIDGMGEVGHAVRAHHVLRERGLHLPGLVAVEQVQPYAVPPPEIEGAGRALERRLALEGERSARSGS